MKRVFDLVVSILSLILLAIPFVILACVILVKMGRPVFFCQVRPGFLGRPFSMIKFRTMTAECDKNGNLQTDSQRLTSLGRFLRASSLDELPELINVIKGDMSLVGPRPLLMEYLTLYNKDQFSRHLVRPGITGWAQVNGRNAISWDLKFKYDLWYVENQSILLDIKILGLTVMKVLKRDGITSEGHATAEKFKG